MAGLLFACSDSSGPDEPDGARGEFLPLAVGNSWLKVHTVTSAEGTLVFTDSIRTSIDESVSVNGETWYKTSSGLYYISRADGLWMASSLDTPPYQIYKLPVVDGEKYTLTDYTAKETHYQVLGVDVPITVAAGSFSCWKIHIDCPPCGIEDTAYIAPGIGDVLKVANFLDGRTMRIEMVNYSVSQ